MSTALSINAVRHVIGGKPVLERAELQIERGEFVALLGPSGCGKSTLLRLIAGLETPSEGTIGVLGAEAGSRSPGVSFVFQDAHLVPWRTVLDNVALPLELGGATREEARRAALAPLADVELSREIDSYPDQLSGGMRMRVSIARALVTRPELLLMDEPFGALDELTRLRLDERLRSLWQERGMTILFVTHSLIEAVYLSTRALVMSKRPARVVLDRSLPLSSVRSAALRTTSDFTREVSLLYDALEAHGALDDEPS